mmetsp:Transcript_483/g.1139  ORF Transcript_483/g.1139 Transcript_483/m.1139 type:complete len:133 (+) Transcript_483:419-817(+)
MSVRSHVLRDMRTTLRHLNKLPSTRTPSSPLRQEVLSRMRVAAGMTGNEGEADRARRVLAAYAENVSSVTELTTLRGLDTGEKMTQSERVQAMASRVGLGTPQEYTGEEDDEEGQQQQPQQQETSNRAGSSH